MKKYIRQYWLMVVAIVMTTACQKEHFFDGGVHTGKLDMNIYDFLKSRPLEFDTIVWILDKTGLAEEVKKSNITFIAPKDLCVVKYLKQIGGAKLDTMNTDTLRKAMSKYILPNVRVWREEVPFDYEAAKGGGQFVKTLSGDSLFLDSPRRDDYNGVKEAGPKFFRVWYHNGYAKFFSRRFDANNTWPETEVNGKRWNPWISSGIVITTDLQATNGNIQVLNGTHTFNFPFK
ncbi:hypothetical protein ACQKLP_10060 [Chitinophaga sp. NPDC101104]|uniref:hypothetical protein n=1 Tax=Chitinophaga sp. NPDC101104 TaxID=3390561 RepID=UPI003CFE6359